MQTSALGNWPAVWEDALLKDASKGCGCGAYQWRCRRHLAVGPSLTGSFMCWALQAQHGRRLGARAGGHFTLSLRAWVGVAGVSSCVLRSCKQLDDHCVPLNALIGLQTASAAR